MVLPGSKNVRDDLQWLKDNGWVDIINRHLRLGGKVLGICGGYQILGRMIHDPDEVEGPAGSSTALGLLDIETTLTPQKTLTNVVGDLAISEGDDSCTVKGYEIHAGISEGPGIENPLVTIEASPDGAISSDNAVAGSYLHGLFDEPQALEALLKWSGMPQVERFDYPAYRSAEINRLADAVETAIPFDTIKQLLKLQ